MRQMQSAVMTIIIIITTTLKIDWIDVIRIQKGNFYYKY
jgi:hypothetical protein